MSTQRKRVWPELTEKQDATLQLYAEWYGKGWQDKLRSDWMRSGTYAPLAWYHLQQLRNTHGPMWLAQTYPAE